MIKCTRTDRKFKVDFLENKASNEKFLFYIFDFFFRVESPPFRLYHQLPTNLYIFDDEKIYDKNVEISLVITSNNRNILVIFLFVEV